MSRSLLLAVRFFISCLVLLPCVVHAEPSGVAVDTSRHVRLDEIAIGSGYDKGNMKFTQATYKAVSVYLRFGFDISPVLGMRHNNGTLQFAFEPFCNPVSSPGSGVETGLNVFLRYLYPLSSSVKLVSEIGSGPVYLSIDSKEQGRAGFNFLNQFGLGGRVDIAENRAITFGYRYRHISNAGTSQPNRGINTNAVVLSHSWIF